MKLLNAMFRWTKRKQPNKEDIVTPENLMFGLNCWTQAEKQFATQKKLDFERLCLYHIQTKYEEKYGCKLDYDNLYEFLYQKAQPHRRKTYSNKVMDHIMIPNDEGGKSRLYLWSGEQIPARTHFNMVELQRCSKILGEMVRANNKRLMEVLTIRF